MASDEQIPTQEYVLKIGSHTWVDGKTYVVGDKMQLTRDQMERIGIGRFEPVNPSTKKESASAGPVGPIPNPNTEKHPAPAPSKSKG